METKILISGFGGQGVMRLGKILACAALQENKHTTWFPSYGAEMRGGTAHCFVKISPTPIASPLIEKPDIAVIFNQPSWHKFSERIKRAQLVILNSDMIDAERLSVSAQAVSMALNTLARECGNLKVINAIALGLILCKCPHLLQKDTVIAVLRQTFPAPAIFEANLKGFNCGYDAFSRCR